MTRILLILLIILIFVFISCDENKTTIGVTDGILPGGITDFHVIDSTASTVTFAWTAPGDDDSIGTASKYEVGYYYMPEIVLFYWDTLTIKVPNIPAPKPAGSAETLTVADLTYNVDHYFGIRAYDETDNISISSNIVLAIPFEDSVISFNDMALDSAVREHLSMSYDSLLFLSQITSLDSLTADNRNIANIAGIYYLRRLINLDLSNNLIQDISQIGRKNALNQLLMNKLDTLILAHNQISNIDSLALHTGLHFLSLEDNDIDSVDALAGLGGLNTLNLGNNNIINIDDLSNLISLQELYLDSNQIVDIQPLVNNSGLGSGDIIWLNGNPLSTYSSDTLIMELEARNITVNY